jgi:hypothetical protein
VRDRRVLLVAVLAAAGALGARARPALAAPPAPPELVEYALDESYRWVTPRGERAEGTSGRVTVLGDTALWKLDSGRFPRSEASEVLASGGTVTLVDRAGKGYAEAPAAEFAGLFSDPAAPDPGQSSAVVRDLSVSWKAAGASAPFEGLPTARYLLDVKYALVVSTPGRSATVTHEVHASIVAVKGLEGARSPFDDLLRLLPLRGAPREKAQNELLRVEGWPVAVRVESEALWTSEPVGTIREAAQPRPLRSAAAVTRTVGRLVRRKAAEADEALLRVPADFRSRPLERMLRQGAGLLP